jgi:hypothetical protein
VRGFHNVGNCFLVVEGCYGDHNVGVSHLPNFLLSPHTIDIHFGH